MPDRGPRRATNGAFVAVVGPSGAGKDTILSIASNRLRDDGRFHFVRRVITRNAQVHAEDHDCLSPEAFQRAEENGDFCLTWTAHGLSYGLPSDLLRQCDAGRTVVANVSRRALGSAAGRFAAVHVVEISAPRHLLVERIAARGRETAAEIDARLARHVDLVVPEGAFGPHRIDNSGSVDAAATTFTDMLLRVSRSPRESPA